MILFWDCNPKVDNQTLGNEHKLQSTEYTHLYLRHLDSWMQLPNIIICIFDNKSCTIIVNK